MTESLDLDAITKQMRYQFDWLKLHGYGTVHALIAELRVLRSQLAESQREHTGKVLVDREALEYVLDCNNGRNLSSQHYAHLHALRAALGEPNG